MKWKTPELGHLTSSDFENIYEPAEDTFLFLDALELEEEFLLLLHPTLLFELGFLFNINNNINKTINNNNNNKKEWERVYNNIFGENIIKNGVPVICN